MSHLSDEDFAIIVSRSTCYADIVRSLGLRVQGSNYGTIKRRIARQGLSILHFDLSFSRSREKAASKIAVPLDQVLVVGSKYSSNDLKKRLLKENLLSYKCEACGNEGTWQGRPLTLQLDHKNGNHEDNRLENLRILCPNCHTQTGTHSGKRLAGTGKKYACIQCGKPCSKQAKTCRNCDSKNRTLQTHFVWPNNEALSKMLYEKIPKDVAAQIGCSYTRLRKHCQKNGIKMPGCGYWARRNHGYSHEEALISPTPPNPAKRMSQEQIEQARQWSKDGKSNREIGTMLGFHHVTIGRAIGKFGAPARCLPETI